MNPENDVSPLSFKRAALSYLFSQIFRKIRDEINLVILEVDVFYYTAS